MELQPHQQRVVAERAELEDKLGKLEAFLTGERFDAVPDDEKGRLLLQHVLMESYARVLKQRIAAF